MVERLRALFVGPMYPYAYQRFYPRVMVVEVTTRAYQNTLTVGNYQSSYQIYRAFGGLGIDLTLRVLFHPSSRPREDRTDGRSPS